MSNQRFNFSELIVRDCAAAIEFVRFLGEADETVPIDVNKWEFEDAHWIDGEQRLHCRYRAWCARERANAPKRIVMVWTPQSVDWLVDETLEQEAAAVASRAASYKRKPRRLSNNR